MTVSGTDQGSAIKMKKKKEGQDNKQIGKADKKTDCSGWSRPSDNKSEEREIKQA